MKPGQRDVKVYYVNSFINMVKGVLPVPWRLWIKRERRRDSVGMGEEPLIAAGRHRTAATAAEEKGRRKSAPLTMRFSFYDYAFAGFSPRVNPGAGRSSGRTTLGSVLGAACGGGGGGVRSFSGSGLFSISSFTSLASMTSRSSSARAMRSRVSLLLERIGLGRSSPPFTMRFTSLSI